MTATDRVSPAVAASNPAVPFLSRVENSWRFCWSVLVVGGLSDLSVGPGRILSSFFRGGFQQSMQHKRSLWKFEWCRLAVSRRGSSFRGHVLTRAALLTYQKTKMRSTG